MKGDDLHAYVHPEKNILFPKTLKSDNHDN